MLHNEPRCACAALSPETARVHRRVRWIVSEGGRAAAAGGDPDAVPLRVPPHRRGRCAVARRRRDYHDDGRHPAHCRAGSKDTSQPRSSPIGHVGVGTRRSEGLLVDRGRRGVAAGRRARRRADSSCAAPAGTVSDHHNWWRLRVGLRRAAGRRRHRTQLSADGSGRGRHARPCEKGAS